MGATPVPGPMSITGVLLSGGRNSVGGEMWIGSRDPIRRSLSQDEHSPRRGTLRLVLYSTSATSNCTRPGWA